MDEPENPYAPVDIQTGDNFQSSSGVTNSKDRKKINAIIKDAGQFWLALVLCIFCGLIGMLLLGPWYLVRLLQWNAMSNAYPQLLDPNTPQGSLPRRFQAAKWKLIVGLVGGLMLAIAMMGLTVLSFVGVLQ
jgi:hypothetical protein